MGGDWEGIGRGLGGEWEGSGRRVGGEWEGMGVGGGGQSPRDTGRDMACNTRAMGNRVFFHPNSSKVYYRYL